MIKSATWEWEDRLASKGYQTVVGIDEVGRGCWAGPLVAVAYVFTSRPEVALTDSKLLTESRRNELAIILPHYGTYGLGEVSAEEITELGLQAAQYLAYTRALEALCPQPDFLLLDGRRWATSPLPHEAIVKGDSKIASIAAASILAKVYRDTYMKTAAHDAYPKYGFASHVGYGTEKHRKALAAYGVTPLHRLHYKPIQSLLSHPNSG